ncbi:FxSxx-COOH system tetratricopeptide repeat protein [Kitasatospora sp. NPDC058965]|uniref:FxSxx-COOH system tetratricopeptide repeat protein n=1 Tax=Kitasatospora sp. NPDC058965 TaxID=3346682 RepID=UPI0036B31E42
MSYRTRETAALDGAVRGFGLLRAGAARPAPELLLAVDAHCTMAVWEETLAALTDGVARLVHLGGIRLGRLLGTEHAVPGALALEGVGAPAQTGADPGASLPRVLLVVTDGLGSAWRSGAVLPLLQEWARAVPVAVLQLLPQQLWYRTGMEARRVGLRAAVGWLPNAELVCEERDTPLDLLAREAEPAPHPEDPEDTVPIPVLELDARWTEPWARLVAGWTEGAGTGDGRVELTVLSADRWKRRPDAARNLPWAVNPSDGRAGDTARERVSEFRAGASPPAFRLAALLAAAPLSPPVMRAVMRGMPGGEPVHLAELLMSGLVRTGPADPPGPDTDPPFEFVGQVRPELLAAGRRGDTVRVLQEVRELLEQAGGRPLLPPAGEPLDAVRVPAVTRRNAPYLQIELAALRALSGRFLRRAHALQAALQAFDAQQSRRARTDPTTTHTGGPQVSSLATAVSVEGERPAQPRVWGGIPPRNPNFTGRLALLALLEDRLRQGTTAVLPEAIHGMGGVGKTQLAIEYAYRHQADYDIVWWIPAERPGQIGQALVELAQRLGLSTGLEANTAVPALREALREGRPYARWLLIFDNADSPERVQQYFPTGGSGTILVTSRNRRWGLIGGSLEVDVFTREESKELLRRSGPDLADEEADRLATALGDLPLALQQAAAWRAETGMQVAEYLRLFEEKRTELLEVSPPPDYELPVAAAWNVSLDHLESRSPAALRLLQLCAYFAPDPISRSMFSGLGNGNITPELDETLNDPIRLARAIREINRYSLARIDHRTNSIEMHRLVQAVVINRMSPEEQQRMRAGVHLLLAAGDPKSPAAHADWPRYAELYGHAVASRAIDSRHRWVAQLVLNVAKYLYYWGDHEVSLDFSEHAWEAWKQTFGEDDRQTMLMGQWLGFMYLVVGRYRDASAFVARLQEAYARTAPEGGPDSREDALDAFNLEAAVRRAEGDFAIARQLDETVYERARRTFGEDDPITLNAAHNLGVSLRLTGDFQRALELDRRTYAMKVRIFGADYQATLITENSVAIDIREAGDYVEARGLQEAALVGFREVFGADNPQTLQTMRQLSVAVRKEGDNLASLELAQEAADRFSLRYGDTHPQSLAASLTLSVALRHNGDLERARELGAKACERYRRIFDARHPHVLSADLNLAVTLRLLGEVEQAHASNEATLLTLRDRLGDDHPTTVVCSMNLASDLYALGRFEEAKDLDTRTLELSRTALGVEHPITLACAGNLATDLLALGEEGEGLRLRDETVDRMRRSLDEPRLRRGSAEGHLVTRQTAAGERVNGDVDPMLL